MGFRYNRRIRLAAGVRPNLSKSGVGYSIGRRGMWLTKRADGGRQTTVGLPDSGLSYTARLHDHSTGTEPAMAHPSPEQAPGLAWTAPPGWPPPQPGWSPSAGWRPDSSWPPPPIDWQWWQPAPITGTAPARTGTPLGGSRHSTAAVVAALLLFFPLGLYWMWRDRTWSSGLRWTVTAFASLVLIVAVTSSPAKPVVPAQQTASPAYTQALTPAPTRNVQATQAAKPAAAPTRAPVPVAATGVHVAPSTAALPASHPAAAVTSHTAAPQHQAAAPAAPAPPVAVIAPPAPTKPKLCGAPANPYGYNYCGRGSNVYSPPGDICSYFSCIGNFGNGVGYMDECADNMVSMSGGRRGACSHHGGELRPVTS